MPASRSASFIAGLSRHRKAVRTDVPGMLAGLAHLRGRHDVRLDGRLEPIDPLARSARSATRLRSAPSSTTRCAPAS